MAGELHTLGIDAQLEAMARGELSSRALTEHYLARIDALDGGEGGLNCFVHVDAAGALAQADASDTRRSQGEAPGALEGVPIALKDIFVTEGVPTTCASKILAGWTPPYDGTAVRRLREAGAVVLGKLNMDEFAMGSSNENSAYGPVRNPWDRERVSGGSSGGSAAAVAAGLCAGALGTDTGGSIRQPASLCGVVGLKPTYGRVSRYGVVAFASSLDQVGPFARDVAGSARLLGVVAGHDPMDSTSVPEPVPDYAAQSAGDIAGMRIGLPKEYFGEGLDDEVRASVDAAIEQLRSLGASIEEISLPMTEYAVAAYYLICTAEASSNLARYDGVRFGIRAEGGDLREMYESTRGQGFGAEVKRRIMLGTYALSAGYYDAYYLKAQRVRTLIRQDFEAAFEKVDAIVTPTSPVPAFRLGERMSDPLAMYLADIYTISCNLASLPGISLPCGFTGGGLPIGLQLLGRHFEESGILRIARAYEASCEWQQRWPELSP